MSELPARTHRAVLDGASVSVTVTAEGLDVDSQLYSWLDVDDVDEGDHRVRLGLASGAPLDLGGLGATHADFLGDLRVARRRLRLAALTVATGDPTSTFMARAPDGPVAVHLFAKVLVLESHRGHVTTLPLPLIDRVERDGYRITITGRGIEAATVQALGQKTDEFVTRLATARRDLQAAVCAAYTGHEERLQGYVAPDGWANDRATAGAYWGVLLEAARGGDRAAEVAVLQSVSGDRLRMGLYTDGGTSVMPFLLAPVGDRVVVEAVDTDEARATFVFEASDVDRLNAVLVLTSFRREALFLPDDQLGRWAVAVRVWPAVQWARSALRARVVHDDAWANKVHAALAG